MGDRFGELDCCSACSALVPQSGMQHHLAWHAGVETQECGAVLAGSIDNIPIAPCFLPTGHLGSHKNADGTGWTP
jgi:hypothetical protein